jgi:3-methylfumaryl-CoA hydratase
MALSDDEIAHLKSWVGRTQTLEDVIATDRVAAMAATLDYDRAPAPAAALPPGWHWLYFNGAARQSEIGPDGHPRRGGFLPPVPLPRRMWAGGRIVMAAGLKVGEKARRESRIASVEAKRGRSGDLVFVMVQHRIHGEAGLALEEEHDIVYRSPPEAGVPAPKPEPVPTGAVWRREVRPDPVLLFRYSALTFNGHRIHYDQPYVTGVEGYPGLIVHGPLIATLLLDLLGREAPTARLRRFEFRAKSPLFDTAPFHVNGTPDGGGGGTAQLWAEGPDGALAMAASAVVERPA